MTIPGIPMQGDPIIVASLVELHTANEVRAFWAQALAAYTSRSTVVIHINSLSQDGQSSAGISLSTPEETQSFIASCMAAVAELEGSTATTPANQIAPGTDYSNRRVLA